MFIFTPLFYSDGLSDYVDGVRFTVIDEILNR